MLLTDEQLEILIKVFRSGVDRHMLDVDTIRILVSRGLIDSYVIRLTQKGRALLIGEYHMQLIDALAREYESQHPGVYWSTTLRDCINQVVKRLPTEKLTELLTHRCTYIRKRAKACIVARILEKIDSQADKKLTRKLLVWGSSAVEEALIKGWLPTVKEATAQWQKELLVLDHAELVVEYMAVFMQLNGSFSKRVALLQGPFERSAEQFLNEKEN